VEGARQSWRDSAGASPAQVRPSKPPGSECCVRRRRRRTRSVHSGCVGCVIEPRNDEIAGAEAVTYTRHVVLADIMDLAESWGEELGEAAWTIARDYYESRPELLRSASRTLAAICSSVNGLSEIGQHTNSAEEQMKKGLGCSTTRGIFFHHPCHTLQIGR
jgi:hypothetical protein